MRRIRPRIWASLIPALTTVIVFPGGARAAAPAEREPQAITFSQGATLAPAFTTMAAQSLPPPAGAVQFGSAVSVDSDGTNHYVVVGAPASNGGVGRAFVYHKPFAQSTFNGPMVLAPPSSEAREFGASVVIRRGVIIVGAPGSRGGAGSAFAYAQPMNGDGVPILGPPPAFAPTNFDFQQEIRPDTFSGGFGRSVGYDERLGTMFMCGSLCQFFAKVGNQWNFRQAAENVVGSRGAAISVGSPLSYFIAANDSPTPTATLWDWKEPPASGTFYARYIRTLTVGPVAGTFSGLGGVVDRALLGIKADSGQGWVAEFSKNIFTPSPSSNWTQVRAFRASSAGNGFGERVAMVVNHVLVTDSRASGNTVYQIRLDTRGTSNNADDTWTEVSSVSGGPGFGLALGGYADLGVIGDPVSNRAHTVDVATPITPQTYTDSTSGVTITQLAVGDNPIAPTIQTGACGTQFQQGLTSQGRVCTTVTNTAEFVGLATVCFPNPQLREDLKVVRCRQKAACSAAEIRNSATGLCCQVLNHKDNVLNPYCVQTDGFSEFGFGQAIDSDGDFEPNLDDNCPGTWNFFQEDRDGDVVGDSCDNCLNTSNQDQRDVNANGIGDACDPAFVGAAVPVGSAAAPVIGILLCLSGVWCLRRRPRRQ